MSDINRNKVQSFLMINGWKQIKADDPGLRSFEKENNISVDISDDDIVLIGEDGDFMSMPLDSMSAYTLLGVFFHNRYISIDYKFKEGK